MARPASGDSGLSQEGTGAFGKTPGTGSALVQVGIFVRMILLSICIHLR